MLPQYRFYLKTDSDLDWVRTYPDWKDDLSIEWKMESGQMFYRSELSGSLDFIADDYTYIMSKTFGKVFKVKIEVSDGGGTWTHYWDGKFTLTDCKVNTDDRIITVKPQTVDNYTAILAGMDREYDLIKLKPEIVPLNMQRRPAVQIFDTASETVTCICGNISFEQEASLPAENPMQFLRSHCHFGVVESVVSIQIVDPPFGHEAAFAEPFTGTITGDGSILENGYGQAGYYMEYFENGLIGDIMSFGLKVIAYAQPDIVQWQYAGLTETTMPGLPSLIEFEAKISGEVNMNGECNDHGIYSRVICNVDLIDVGEPTFEIPNDDLVAYNRNYRRCYPYEVALTDIVTSTYTQVEPTEWGRSDGGGYFVPPGSAGDYIPIGRNRWGLQSIWLHKTSSLDDINNRGTAGFVLKDSFPLYSCIQVLLAEIAPDIRFDGTTAYSSFLYSDNDPIAGRRNTLFITPKTNIINGEYETPAQKALCTLKDILQMLKNVYNCYWFIGEVNGYPALRIEHVQYFLNGGSYSGTPQVGINLTNMYNVRNWKTWDFGKNEYEYEKIEMPERFQFEWMDEVREIFKGKPIIVVSDFVEQGKIEEITVANFTTDVDYMQLNPSAISQEGFALLNAIFNLNSQDYTVPVVYYVYWDGYNNSIQNGWLSYHELQSAYWRYNMPARKLNIEGIVNSGTRALSVSRNKKQSISVPIGMPDSNGKDFDLMKLVTTGIGNGQIYQASIRLTTRIAKLQLRFETEA